MCVLVPTRIGAFGSKLGSRNRPRVAARSATGAGRLSTQAARGVKIGRPPKLTSHQQKEAIKRRDQGEETLADIARSYNVSAATISEAECGYLIRRCPKARTEPTLVFCRLIAFFPGNSDFEFGLAITGDDP